MEENRLKRCLKGVKGGNRHSGGGWICLLSVTECKDFDRTSPIWGTIPRIAGESREYVVGLCQ